MDETPAVLIRSCEQDRRLHPEDDFSRYSKVQFQVDKQDQWAAETLRPRRLNAQTSMLEIDFTGIEWREAGQDTFVEGSGSARRKGRGRSGGH